MKIMVKKAMVIMAAAIMVGSLLASPVTAEAKGTAFIRKKVSGGVTPKIKSAKRTPKGLSVTVSVPASRVRKLGKVKKITVSVGCTKKGKIYEDYRAKVKVTKKGRNAYTFFLSKNKQVESDELIIPQTRVLATKNMYVSVKLGNKSNWSKLVKVSGEPAVYTGMDNGKNKGLSTTCRLMCYCGRYWDGNDMERLSNLYSAHVDEMEEELIRKCCSSVTETEYGSQLHFKSEEARATYFKECGKHLGYKTWGKSEVIK